MRKNVLFSTNFLTEIKFIEKNVQLPKNETGFSYIIFPDSIGVKFTCEVLKCSCPMTMVPYLPLPKNKVVEIPPGGSGASDDTRDDGSAYPKFLHTCHQ